LILVLGWLVLEFTAQAASFDCGKAGTKVEKIVCSDADLSKLDEELNAAYTTLSVLAFATKAASMIGPVLIAWGVTS
jgi:uncharacterized protein